MIHMKLIKTTLVFTAAIILSLFAVIASADTVKLANGVTLFYRTSGNGQIPVVFIHGWGSSSAIWDKVLEGAPKRYVAFALDLRGFGDSDKPNTGYRFGDMAEDIAQFLDAMRIKKAILVGHSFGGMILQDFAVAHSDRILALILSDNLARNLPPFGLNEARQKFIDSITTNENDNRKVFTALLGRYYDASNLAPGDLQKFVEIALKASPTALKKTYKGLLTIPQIPKDKYDSIQVPTLIVLGSHDITPFSHFVAINDGIKNSKIFVVERSGHTPMWEQPKRWMEGAFGFLKELRFKSAD